MPSFASIIADEKKQFYQPSPVSVQEAMVKLSLIQDQKQSTKPEQTKPLTEPVKSNVSTEPPKSTPSSTEPPKSTSFTIEPLTCTPTPAQPLRTTPSVTRPPQPTPTVVRGPQTFNDSYDTTPVSQPSQPSSKAPHAVVETQPATSVPNSTPSRPTHSMHGQSFSSSNITTSTAQANRPVSHAPPASMPSATPSTFQANRPVSHISTASSPAQNRPISVVQTSPPAKSHPFRPAQVHASLASQAHRPQSQASVPNMASPPVSTGLHHSASVSGSSPGSNTPKPGMTLAEYRMGQEVVEAKLRHADMIRTLLNNSTANNGNNLSPGGRNFTDSKDDTPRLFLIAPMLEDPLIKGPYKPIRILLPCQAPSAKDGVEDSVHMTSHNGYVIKNPNDFLHNNRDAINMIGTLTSFFFKAAAVVGKLPGVPDVGGDVAAGAATAIAGSIRTNSENRTHLNAAGLDTGSLYEMHLATENHQREALKILLRAAAASDPTQSMTGELNGIVMNNGRTIWVCKECYDQMLKGEPIKTDYHVSLRDYESLTKRGTDIAVLLRSSASLIIFTNALKTSSPIQRLTIRIKSDYFEAPERSHRAAQNSIQSLFNELSQAILRHRLSHLEIHGNSSTGLIYTGFQSILKCSSLEQLTILGVPRFLQGYDLPRDCRMLNKLVLDGVLIDTAEAANNLRAVMLANPGLVNLRVSRAGFTPLSLTTLFYTDKTKDSVNAPAPVPKYLKKMTHVNLSDNNMDVITAMTFARMAFKSPSLVHLDLSSNSRIGDSGCRAILTLMKEKNRKITEFKTERTGIEMRTRLEIDQCLRAFGG